jgi:hypothetical protein
MPRLCANSKPRLVSLAMLIAGSRDRLGVSSDLFINHSRYARLDKKADAEAMLKAAAGARERHRYRISLSAILSN